MRLINLNGDLVPEDDARISVLDHGLLYGMGLFETVRGYGGRLFRMDRHLARLRDGAGVLAIPLPWTDEDLESAVLKTLEANGKPDGAARLSVTRGAGDAAPDAPAADPLFFVTVRDWSPPPAELYARGYSAITSRSRRVSTEPLSNVKSLNCVPQLLARREARQRGADEAILLNEQENVACASAANLFCVVEGVIMTPALDEGCLPGITRETVLRHLQAAGLPLMETCVLPEFLTGANEAFLTNSLIEVMPLISLDGTPIGSGRPGPVGGSLREAYVDLIRSERGQ